MTERCDFCRLEVPVEHICRFPGGWPFLSRPPPRDHADMAARRIALLLWGAPLAVLVAMAVAAVSPLRALALRFGLKVAPSSRRSIPA